MALTDISIRKAKPRDKAYKLADGQGMYLHVTPAGGKHWRLKYRFNGVEKLLSIGSYPEIGLSAARRRREEARALIEEGKDPSREKQRSKLAARRQAADTFSSIAREYCAKRKRDGEKGWAPATAKRSEYLLSLLDPSIGRLAIAEIEPTDILEAVRKIEDKGTWRAPGARFNLLARSSATPSPRLASDQTRHATCAVR